MNRILSSRFVVGISLLLCIGVNPAVSLAAEKTKERVEQETLKAKTVMWREAQPTPDNPTKIRFNDAFPDKTWWEQFQDPYLSACIQKAVNANLDLALAQERIEESRALARLSLAKELPQLSIGSNFSRTRSSATTIRPSRTGSSASSSSGTSSPSSGGGFALGQVLNYWSVPLSASYEADIWQKNRDTTRAAKKNVEAAERLFQATHVMLVTDVANAYFNLLAADQAIVLRKRIIQAAEADLKYEQNRFEAGLEDEESVVLRQGRLADFQALLQGYYRDQALALNQLAVLMGETPYEVGDLDRSDFAQYPFVSELPTGIPSDMITRRPDILAVENQLASSGYLVRAARKEFLPMITLTGQFGYASAQFKDLFKWDSYLASVGASAVQRLFTGGQLKANLRVAKSRNRQQLLIYRNTILQAFREVDDSIAALKSHRNVYDNYEASLQSLERRSQIQQNRLAAGAISQGDINPVDLEIFQAQERLVQTKLLMLSDSLSLYKALGGGY